MVVAAVRQLTKGKSDCSAVLGYWLCVWDMLLVLATTFRTVASTIIQMDTENKELQLLPVAVLE